MKRILVVDADPRSLKRTLRMLRYNLPDEHVASSPTLDHLIFFDLLICSEVEFEKIETAYGLELVASHAVLVYPAKPSSRSAVIMPSDVSVEKFMSAIKALLQQSPPPVAA